MQRSVYLVAYLVATKELLQRHGANQRLHLLGRRLFRAPCLQRLDHLLLLRAGEHATATAVSISMPALDEARSEHGLANHSTSQCPGGSVQLSAWLGFLPAYLH